MQQFGGLKSGARLNQTVSDSKQAETLTGYSSYMDQPDRQHSVKPVDWLAVI